MSARVYFSPHVSREKFDSLLAEQGEWDRYNATQVSKPGARLHENWHTYISQDEFAQKLKDHWAGCSFEESQAIEQSALCVSDTRYVSRFSGKRVHGTRCIFYHREG